MQVKLTVFRRSVGRSAQLYSLLPCCVVRISCFSTYAYCDKVFSVKTERLAALSQYQHCTGPTNGRTDERKRYGLYQYCTRAGDSSVGSVNVNEKENYNTI